MKPALVWFSAAVALAAACVAGFWLGQNPTPAAASKPPPAATRPKTKAAPPPQAGQTGTPKAEPPPQGLDLEAHGRALAAKGIGVALAFLETLKDPDQQALFIRGMFQHAATLGVAQALAWAQDLKDQNHRDTALATLLQEWSNVSAAAINQSSQPVALNLGAFLLQSRRATPEEILPLANTFLSGDPRAQLLSLIANAMFATGADPASILALGQDLEGQAQKTFLTRFTQTWAAKDPDSARAWAATLQDDELRIEMLARVMETQAQSDISSAFSHLNDLPADHPRRIQTVRQLATQMAAKDPAAAQHWQLSLPPGPERDAVTRGINDLTPVGIGVAIGQEDAEGYFPIRQVLADGIAGRTGALQAGDRIVAITDAKGAWVPLQGRPLQEVVDLVRGPEGSTVSLQVLPAGSTAPKTVRLPRQSVNLQGGQN